MNRDKKGNWSDWEDGELPSEFAVAEVPSCGDAVDEVKAGSECKAREVAEGRLALLPSLCACVGRFAALLLPDEAWAKDWGAAGSQVVRLQATPYRAQFEHGLSSSHLT